jgi:flagellar FliJ protein
MNYRKTLENLAQRDMQEAMAVLYEENKKLEFMQQQIVDAREKAFRDQTKGGNTADSLMQVQEFILGQDVRIERQKTKIQECENKVEELREILRQKAIEYKIIEGLRDRRKEEHKIAERKRDQKIADDMTVMRHRIGEK